jgi:hypothetical protein
MSLRLASRLIQGSGITVDSATLTPDRSDF